MSQRKNFIPFNILFDADRILLIHRVSYYFSNFDVDSSIKYSSIKTILTYNMCPLGHQSVTIGLDCDMIIFNQDATFAIPL